MIQMISVDDPWVATVGRPPQLTFALSQVVRALLWCSWAVSPIHLSFCACPQTQTATATKKIPRLREAIKSKRSCRTLTRHFIFPASCQPFQFKHTCGNADTRIDLAHSLGLAGKTSLASGCHTLEGSDESPADLPHSHFPHFPLSTLSEDGVCCCGQRFCSCVLILAWVNPCTTPCLTRTTTGLSRPGSSTFAHNSLPLPWLLAKLLALPAP